ncbi:hypothetical protein NEDG_01246 [Nematocida displodere]|uniref:RING-type domain-containing protein n=1 Tax=Nematocida displodere TaxID=1805483 RepID=A0A177EAY8_9MICR|nr:hypothetical protein NEDG_01246 [Nematocida displodere]
MTRHPVIKLILAIYTIGAHAAGVPLPTTPQNISENYIESSYTNSTLAFFNVSGSALDTATTPTGKVCIAKVQARKVFILLKHYHAQNIPNRLVRGIWFRELVLADDMEAARHGSAAQTVKAVFKALGSLSVDKLTIYSLKNIAKSETCGLSRADLVLARIARVCLVDDAMEGESTNSEADTSPNTGRLKVRTRHLVLKDMSESSLRWLFAQIDVSKSRLFLSIYYAPDITTLSFLDHFMPKVLTGLYVFEAKKLQNIDFYQALGTNLSVLRLVDVHRGLTASPDTLAALARSCWSSLDVPANLWSELVNISSQPVVAESVVITVKFLQKLDVLWSIIHHHRARVRRLILFSSVGHGKLTKDRFRHTLDWVGRCFDGVEEVNIDIYKVFQTIVGSFLKDRCIYAKTLPKLAHLTLGALYCQVYNPEQAILWVSSGMCKLWARGVLCDYPFTSWDNLLFSIDRSPPPLFNPSTHADVPKECFMCSKTAEALSMLPNAYLIYLGVVCRNGHMACEECFRTATRTNPNRPLSCGRCSNELICPGVDYVVT